MNDTEFLKSMGARIKAIRQKKKMYLKQLAKLCDLDYSSISRIENGKYSSMVLTLKRIADALNVEVKDFL